MSWDKMPPGRNAEGYPDPTATEAIASALKSQRGASNRIAGDHFEKIIEYSLLWYEDRGEAVVEKTPEPMKPLGKPNKKRQFLAHYVKAAQPDFKGTIHGGRSVVFEAKHTDTEKIEYSRLTPEQVERMEKHDRLGAACFVLVSFGLNDFYRIPWKVWERMQDIYGHKHMKQAECEPYRVQYIAGVLKLLEGIETRFT